MKAIKIAGMCLAAALLLMVLGLVGLLAQFDSAGLKQQAIELVRQQQQRTLRLDGDWSLTCFPHLGLRLDKVALSEVGGEGEFIQIAHLHVGVQLLPLLSRQVVINGIELHGVQANFLQRQDGSFNVNDFLAGRRQGGESVKFDIERVVLTDAAISYRDEASGQLLRWSKVAMHMGRLGKVAHGQVRVSGQVEGSKPTLALGVELSGNYAINVDQRQFLLSAMRSRLSGDVEGLKSIDFSLAAKTLAVAADKGEVEMAGLRLELKSMLAGDTLIASLDVPQLKLAADRLGAEPLHASVRLLGKERQFDGRLELRVPEAVPPTAGIGELALQWNLRQGAMALRGQVAGVVEGNFKSPMFALPKLAGDLEIDHPGLPTKQIKLPLTGRLRWEQSKPGLFAELAARYKETQGQSRWQISSIFPLVASVDIDFDRLNVDELFPAQASAEPPASPMSAQWLALEIPHGIDLHGVLRVAVLQARNAKFHNFQAELRLAEGRLALGSAIAAKKPPLRCEKPPCR